MGRTIALFAGIAATVLAATNDQLRALKRVEGGNFEVVDTTRLPRP